MMMQMLANAVQEVHIGRKYTMVGMNVSMRKYL